MTQAGRNSGAPGIESRRGACGYSRGSTYTVMYWYGSEGGAETSFVKEVNDIRQKSFSLVREKLKHGTLREYKRIICFDNDVLANDHELKSGVLRVGEGPGTIDRQMGGSLSPDDGEQRVFPIPGSRRPSVDCLAVW